MPKDVSFARDSAKGSRGIPPTVLVLLSIGSVQLGAAIAKGLFDAVGPGGTVLFRISLSALVLLLLWRPKLGGYARAEYGLAVVFGLALAAMNLSLYLAIDRIPLGVAVTLEFVGPLGVAVAGSRRLLDGLWVVLAATGVLLLAPLNVLGATDLDPVGVAFALLAGVFWASYILLSARVGGAFPGGDGARDLVVRRHARPSAHRHRQWRIRPPRSEASAHGPRCGNPLLRHPLSLEPRP